MQRIVFWGGKIMRNKGKSVLMFPNEYVVIDIETTGLDTRFDSIIEVSAIRYKDGVEVERFAELSKPSSYDIVFEEDLSTEKDYLFNGSEYFKYVDDFITELTGITNEMLSKARDEEEVLKDFYNFIGKDILVGHNVNFDINFLYDALLPLGFELNNDYIDTLRLARWVNPELSHHRQSDMANLYKITVEQSHRAEADCFVCNQVFIKLIEDMNKKGLSFEDFKKSKSHKILDPNSITSDKEEFDTTHPIYGKSVCFTGTLEKMQRKDALQIVADFGGIPTDSVTKTTNFLILGNNDYCKTIKDGKSSKHKKAENLILKGADLQILSENAFYEMIEE